MGGNFGYLVRESNPVQMKRSFTLFLFGALSLVMLAANGGPDQYGYIWKDSNEPGGPVYAWVDITATGIPVTGLADDNTFGPYIMGGNMPYYWYDVKKVWVASNGYVAFNGGNIAATFPTLPSAGGTDNYIAVLMSDLTFSGAGNPGQCFLQDEPARLIVSWINVPFWSVAAPGYTGSNTFQLILNKADSTITMQYQSVAGVTSSNGPIIGIESSIGTIGLAVSQSLMPAAGYAVRYYNPAVPLLQVVDAAVDWVDVDGTGGTNMAVGASLPLAMRIRNTGNQNLSTFTVTSSIIGPSGQVVLTETVQAGPLQPNGTTEPPLALPFVPTAAGTYRHRVVISGITGELISSNNTLEREIGVYSPTANINSVSWAGPADDGVGLGWNGGDGGVAVYIMPPFQPCQITATTIRIASNAGAGFTMRVYDDDGPGGTPGTLLDSLMVSAGNGAPGDHVYPLHAPIQSTSGGYYVVWYMQGPNVNIALDIVPPFSLQTFEVLGGAWAEYRNRTSSDFHLGLQVQLPPFLDVGVLGFVGITQGQNLAAGATVQALVHNFGNTPAAAFPVNYRFGNGPVVTANYAGANIAPGNSGIMAFPQPFAPAGAATGALCAWTSAAADEHGQNDTACVNINAVVGIAEAGAAPLTILPVPATDRVAVVGLPPGKLLYQVTDMKAAVLMAGERTVQDGRLPLDVQGLADGAYLIKVVQEGNVLRGRFVVRH